MDTTRRFKESTHSLCFRFVPANICANPIPEKKSAIEKGKYPGHGIRGFVSQMHQGSSHFTLTTKRNLEVTGPRKLHVFIVKFCISH